MLHAYGLKLGVKLLLRGKWRRSLHYLVIPVNYWRALEFRLVWNEVGFHVGDRVLDIGSPKLLSLYVARKTGAEVFATDIEDYFVDEYRLLRQMEGVPAERFHIQVEDGRRLSFPNGCFSKVYSISVLEHIPDVGDTACAREMARVLAEGGRCAITVPFSPDSLVEHRRDDFYWAQSSVGVEDGEFFFQRKYSEEDLFTRLINPSGLRLRKLGFIGERVTVGPGRELMDLLPPVTGPIQPLLSRLFLSKPVESWKELKKPLCALIVLEK